MIPAIIPLATQLAADFGVGYIVHGGVKLALCTSELTLAKKACVGVAEMAMVGIGCDKVNTYIDDSYTKLAEFMVKNDLDKKFTVKKGGKK